MATAAIKFTERTAAVRYRFLATIFLGSFLLFLVQPMIGRMALPRLGGAPAVWNSAMLVYQALLLGGYAYAHWLGRFAARTQARIHLTGFAIAALMLPITLGDAVPGPQSNIFLWVPWLLASSIGPLFFIIAAQAPLIQRWYTNAGGGDPYPLYAASNLGSFAGLISYPLLIEPLLPVAAQSLVWSAGYVGVALLVAWCALRLPRGPSQQETAVKVAAPSRVLVARWIGLAAIPSGLMLSTTLYLSTEIIAMPLLWVVPLGLYLLSFSVAFAEGRFLSILCRRLAPFALVAGSFGVFADTTGAPWLFALAGLAMLFIASVALHAALFDLRPDPSRLTGFYLAMSVGGVIGGILCALLAPMLFDWTYEHPLLIAATAFALPIAHAAKRPASMVKLAHYGSILAVLLSLAGHGAFGLMSSAWMTGLASALLAALALLAVGQRLLFATLVGALMLSHSGWARLALSADPGRMTRSFFGVYTVLRGKDARLLVHGTTLHGVQNTGSPDRERMKTSYYAAGSGVGMAMAAVPKLFGDKARIDVVGLGAGTLACYARPGQRWTFFEIDPAVEKIARDPAQFSFLSRCLPGVPIRIGDARLTLSQEPTGSSDALVVDAFSSDAVPMHLLTLEAFAVYRRHLTPNGLLMVHISNRNLTLEPVIAAAARAGWTARVRRFAPSPAQLRARESSSLWVAMSPSAATIARLSDAQPGGWRPLRDRPGFAPWTDDHASILSVIG